MAIYQEEFFVSSKLRQLVKDNFKTIEQIRFERQQKATWASVVIAFLIGIASIWIGICK